MTSRAEKPIGFSLLSTWFPLGTAGFATWDLVQAILNPVITVTSSGTGGSPKGLHGTAQSVIVKLTDPSFTDRLVACLPGLLNFVLILGAYGYVAWEARNHTYNKKASQRLVLLIGLSALICLLAQPAISLIIEHHFDVDVPLHQSGGVSMLLVAGFMMLLLGAVGNRIHWLEERQRAEKLNSELQDVV